MNYSQRLFLDYPVYPVYFELFGKSSHVAELKLPPAKSKCSYYYSDEQICFTEFEDEIEDDFAEAFNDFSNGILLNKTNIIGGDDVKSKTAILSCHTEELLNIDRETNNLSYLDYLTYLNPVNWIYSDQKEDIFDQTQIKLLQKRYEELNEQYGMCVIVILYNNGEYADLLLKLKKILYEFGESHSNKNKNNTNNMIIEFLNSDVMGDFKKGNIDEKKIADLMILCGSRAVPFLGTLIE